MADSIVSVFVDKLGPLIVKEAAFLRGVEDQLILLRNQLEWIKSFLREAQQKRRESHLVEVWVAQAIDLAYDAEDVVDACILHVELQRRRNFIKKAMNFVKKVKTLHQLGNRIEQFNKRAQIISDCRSHYAPDVSNSTQESASKMAENMAYRRRRIDTLGESNIVGFKGEQTKLVGQLKDAEDFPSLKVISIKGMGGLGKTTLARVVYNHVSHHFKPRVWITVSQKYDAKDLLLTALKHLAGEDQRWAQMDNSQLEEEVRKRLEGKRYLVVIDDVWNAEDWERISIAFPNSKKGSRIILTTRNDEVALHAVTSREHRLELRLLDEDERWELFCRKVFSESGGACPGDLAGVGKEIVGKCGGLPLAIVVIGGLLVWKERTISAWRKVRDSAKWHLSQDSNLCREILSLSYNDLPHYLKSCFLYLGLFPEDYEIPAERLIRYWVAEGFVQPRGEEKIEDVAEDYLEELIQRSMIQVAERMYLEGPVVSCRIHDLLRDLAVSEGRKDKFMNCHSSNKQYVMSSDAKFRRFAIHSTTGDEHEDQVYHTVITSNPHLRSLLLFQSTTPSGPIPCHATNMLRVLDMGFADLRNKNLPKEIGNLFFLHYLRLNGDNLTCLPNSIGKLVNLQTLDLGEAELETLPKTIWKLKNLRHMYLDRDCKMSGRVARLCRLNDFGRNLLTLQVGDDVLVEMSDVLVKAECLRTLILTSLGESLKCFPLSLVHLTIAGPHFAGPSSLPNLKSLRLIGIRGREAEMIFGREQFSQLEYLELSYIYGGNIEWRVEEGGLSSLRDLKIFMCPFLKKLPDGLKSATSLQRITVRDMPSEFTERLKENGEDWDIIKHVPTIDISGWEETFLKKLPDGLKSVTSLQRITVRNMPLEFKNRLKENGEDWDIIKHVRNLCCFFHLSEVARKGSRSLFGEKVITAHKL